MRTRLCIRLIVVWAAALIGSMSNTAWAQRSGYSVVAGRQQVRAILAVAWADGTLTTKEQYSILKKGKRLLPPDELEDLKRTLLLLSTSSSAPRLQTPSPEKPPAATKSTLADPRPTLAKRPEANRTPGKQAGDATRTKSVMANEKETAKTVAYEELAEPEDEENPFQDEDLPESLQAAADPTLTFSEGCQGYETCEGCDNCVGLARLSRFGLFNQGCEPQMHGLPDVRFLTAVEAFKGPLDLDNQNGNFGMQFAVNAGLPLVKRLGIGVQAGTSAVLADFHGTQFTGSTIRSQSFTTVGLFQRIPVGARRVQWGFAHDWLYDDYYSSLQMSQWRVKLAYDWSRSDEIGIWSSIPNDGDTAVLRSGQAQVQFERLTPIAQMSFYHSHRWNSGARTTTWLGMADTPGELILGGSFLVPLTSRLGIVGTTNYVAPSANGAWGQDEEQWYVSLGIEYSIGGAGNRCPKKKLGPLFPLANNGNFAFRRY